MITALAVYSGEQWDAVISARLWQEVLTALQEKWCGKTRKDYRDVVLEPASGPLLIPKFLGNCSKLYFPRCIDGIGNVVCVVTQASLPFLQ